MMVSLLVGEIIIKDNILIIIGVISTFNGEKIYYIYMISIFINSFIIFKIKIEYNIYLIKSKVYNN